MIYILNILLIYIQQPTPPQLRQGSPNHNGCDCSNYTPPECRDFVDMVSTDEPVSCILLGVVILVIIGLVYRMRSLME